MVEPDVLELGPRPGRFGRWPIVGLVALLVVAGIVWLAHRDGERAAPPAASSPAAHAPATAVGAQQVAACAADHPPDRDTTAVTEDVVALAITPPFGHSTLETHDAGATIGPWTVTVRAPNGTLAQHGAVITYPVAAPELPLDSAILIHGRPGWALGGEIVWAIDHGFARARGDVPGPDLLRIAEATTVTNGRPHLPLLSGYRVVGEQAYRAPVRTEVRYGASELDPSGQILGGLVYTGLLRAGGFEDQLFLHAPVVSAGTVNGEPAVLSSVMGGNATVAWEVAPGVIAYVGYSGGALNARTTCALLTEARRASLVRTAQWRATAPDVFNATNDFQ